jgi:hypothetical protein
MDIKVNKLRRENDFRILHTGKKIIECEKVLNEQVDILLDCVGLTREELEEKKDEV